MHSLHKSKTVRNNFGPASRCAMLTALALTALLLLPPTRPALGYGNSNRYQKGKRVESYSGQAVRLRARQLLNSNKAVARAMRDFEKRGLEPIWDESVTALAVDDKMAKHSKPGGVRRVSFTDDVISDGTSEMTFITYVSSSNLWEGIIYINSPNENDTYSASLDSPNIGWDVAYEYWYPPDGEDPICTGGRCTIGKNNSTPRNDDRQLRIVNVSYPGLSATPRMSIWGRIKQWWSCTKGGCYWASQSCGGFICRVRVCAQAAIGCLF